MEVKNLNRSAPIKLPSNSSPPFTFLKPQSFNIRMIARISLGKLEYFLPDLLFLPFQLLDISNVSVLFLERTNLAFNGLHIRVARTISRR